LPSQWIGSSLYQPEEAKRFQLEFDPGAWALQAGEDLEMQKNKLGHSLFLSSLFIGSMLGACGPRATPPGPETAAGVYQGAGYEYFRWEEGLRLMIWHQDPEFSGCRSSSSTTDHRFVLDCQASSRTGVEFGWRLETEDGTEASLSINGREFDLDDGALFLMRTSAGKAEITQLPRDLSGLRADSDAVVQFGLKDPELGAFLPAGGGP
jgi:hypothetical protein